MKVSVHAVDDYPFPDVDIEDQPRAGRIVGFLLEANGNEDIYLQYIAKAEAGEPDVIGDHGLWTRLYPGRVVIEEMYDPPRGAEGPSPYTELTLAEAKQLVLDWLEAKKKWYAERRADPAVALPAGPSKGATRRP